MVRKSLKGQVNMSKHTSNSRYVKMVDTSKCTGVSIINCQVKVVVLRDRNGKILEWVEGEWWGR